MHRFYWLAVVFLVTHSGCLGKTVPEPLILGHLAPLTGPDQAAGEVARQAIEIQLARLSEQGSIPGNRPVLVLHVDSRGDARTVSEEAVRLITVNRVSGLIGNLSPDLGEKLVKQAQAYNVPVILTGEGTSRGNLEGVWQMNVLPANRGKALAQWVEENKYRQISLVVDRKDPGCVSLASEFTKVLSKTKEIQLRESQWDSNQWKMLHASVSPKPDALLLAVPSAEILKLRSCPFDFKIPILYGGEDTGLLPPLKIPSEETFLLATVVSAEGLTTAGKEFATAFGKQYDQGFPLFPVIQTADALRLLLDFVPANKNQSFLKPREKLTIPDPFQSYTGKVTFRGQQTERPLFLLEQNGSKTRFLGPVDASHQEP